MKGKSANLEAREAAFQAYRECGGNIEAAVRALKKKGYSLSKPTLYDWMEKYNFKERLAEADSKAQEAKDVGLTTEAMLLVDLTRQKKKYETYFEGLGNTIDNQAQYAYANLIKTIIDVKARTASDKAGLYLEFLRELVAYMVAHDQEAAQAIERHLDGFSDYAKGKYAA